MLASAYWHGLQPGLYLSFLSVPLWLAAERALWGGGRRGAPPWLLTMRVFEYLGMGFVLREGGATLRYWASVYFCLHLLPLGILLLAPLLRAGRGSPETEGGGGGSPSPGDPRLRRRRDPPSPADPERWEGRGTPDPPDPKS